MSIQFSRKCFMLFLMLLAVPWTSAAESVDTTTTSIAPSIVPNIQPSPAPTASIVPTASHTPTAKTLSPAPSTSEPPSTLSPAPSASVVPTSNATLSIPPSLPPSKSPSPSIPPSKSPSPSLPPSTSPAPSQEPTGVPAPPAHHHVSAWAILGKTIAWLLISALSILAFGALFSNRYRIYYYLQSAWYTFLGWNATRKVLRFLRLDGYFGGYRESSSLNGIIFDNDLTEGLMMQDA